MNPARPAARLDRHDGPALAGAAKRQHSSRACIGDPTARERQAVVDH